MTASPDIFSGAGIEVGLPENHINVLLGADGGMQFSGHPDAVAQAVANLRQAGGNQVALPAAESPYHSENEATVYDNRSSLHKFMRRHIGALTFAGVVFTSSTAAYSAAYSAAHGHTENLFTHPSEFKQPIHQVKDVVHFVKEI
jgi:hypothetical protein